MTNTNIVPAGGRSQDGNDTPVGHFQFPTTGQTVRTLTIDGDPWFVHADACAILGLANTSQSASYLDDDEKQQVSANIISNDVSARGRDPWIISESGLYSLILRSRKPEAKAFKRWITHEVLPSIRKTGSYSIERQVPTSFAEALELAAAQQRAIEARDAKLAIAAPKADAWDVLASAEGDYSVREAANILNRDPSIDTGQNRLFKTLRDLGLIDSKDRPYANHSRHVVLRSRSWRTPDGVEHADDQVRITVDGLRYLRKRLGSTPALPGLETAA